MERRAYRRAKSEQHIHEQGKDIQAMWTRSGLELEPKLDKDRGNIRVRRPYLPEPHFQRVKSLLESWLKLLVGLSSVNYRNYPLRLAKSWVSSLDGRSGRFLSRGCNSHNKQRQPNLSFLSLPL